MNCLNISQHIFSVLAILAAQTDQTRIKRLKIVISEKYEVEIAGTFVEHAKINGSVVVI